MGHFHQASDEIFRHEAAGAQCATMCVMASAATLIKSPSDWQSNDLDTILMQGDQEHRTILKTKHWPFLRKDPRLDVDEMPKEITLRFANIIARTSIRLVDDGIYGFGEEIQQLLNRAIEISPETNFIIRMQDKCRAILCDSKKRYSLFDPHACNELGVLDNNGSACLLRFKDINAIGRFLFNNIEDKAAQIDITTVKLDIIHMANSCVTSHVTTPDPEVTSSQDNDANVTVISSDSQTSSGKTLKIVVILI
jgi:hypothetical protein